MLRFSLDLDVVNAETEELHKERVGGGTYSITSVAMAFTTVESACAT